MDFHKFSILFDANKLKADLEKCKKAEWPLHFNKNDFTGSWSSFSLRSISGKENDIYATPNASFIDTPTLSQCAYFQEIINSFNCQKEAVRLLSLSPNSFIKEHKDANAGYKDGFFRIHIPIQTNGKVLFTLNKIELKMNVGECWYADFNLPHFVANNGTSDRIHLVIDCLRNNWSDQLFKSIGYDFEVENELRYSKEYLIQMIDNLRLMNTETANKMVKDFENKLNVNDSIN